MDAAAVLADLRYRGIVLIPNGSDRLIARPGSRLTDADREAIRRHKSELLQLLTSPNDDYDDLIFTSSLAALADAIASAPRSPVLDDLAIARAARAYIEPVRAIRSSSYEVRREATLLINRSMERAAEAIRHHEYNLAFDVLDSLAERVRSIRTH